MFVFGFAGEMMMRTMIALGLMVLLSCMVISIAECRRLGDVAGILASCNPAGYLNGNSHECNREHGSDCCESGRR